MKVLVLYNSETGNTKKVAEAIYEEFKGEAKLMETKSIKDISEIDGYEYIFIGFFVDKGYPDEPTMELLPKLKEKKLGLFSTLGAYPYSMQAFRVFARAEQVIDKSNRIEGCYICQGRVSDESLKRIASLPPDDPKRSKKSTLRREIGMSHPDSEDLENARRLFRNIVDRDLKGF